MILSVKKIIASVIAVLLTVVILFSGTFAWQSISQEALNVVRGTINPGGRLHDDFNNVTFDSRGISLYTTKTFDKNVYVENFTSLLTDGVPIYARVRLDEYMEVGEGAGELNTEGTGPADSNQAVSLVEGTKLWDKTTWKTYLPGNTDQVYRTYWTWTHEGGSAVYMPTFNKDNMSLKADINGTFDASFLDHTAYTVGDTKEAIAYYTDGQGGQKGYTETHTAKETLGGEVLTMNEWVAAGSVPGNFWVWDTDGWAYWANPIMPDTATGLLLDQIQRTENPIEGQWYYGINVVAQFITADDLGKDTNTGFYDTAKGEAPSQAALTLLEKIGVQVDDQSSALRLEPSEGALLAATESELSAALEKGGEIRITADIELSKPLVARMNATVDLDGHTISNSADFDAADGPAALIAAEGLCWLDIEGGTVAVQGIDAMALAVYEGATLFIYDGTYVGKTTAVYAEEGEIYIFGGSYQLLADTEETPDHSRLLDCADDAYADFGAKIVVYGGDFVNFDPTLAGDGSFVAAGYMVEAWPGEGNTVYSVLEKEVDETMTEETTVEETVTEEASAENAVTEEVTTEDTMAEEVTAEEVTTEAVPEEVTTEEATGEEATGEKTPAEETTTAEEMTTAGDTAALSSETGDGTESTAGESEKPFVIETPDTSQVTHL